MENKLDIRSILCYLVVYPEHSLGYLFYFLWEKKKTQFVLRNATFLEKKFLHNRKGNMIELEEVQEPRSKLIKDQSN